MTVTLKLYCPGIEINMTGVERELQEGDTVKSVLLKYIDETGTTEEILHGTYMINRDAANLGTTLNDGDELIAIKVINGG